MKKLLILEKIMIEGDHSTEKHALYKWFGYLVLTLPAIIIAVACKGVKNCYNQVKVNIVTSIHDNLITKIQNIDEDIADNHSEYINISGDYLIDEAP
jgi:hypothetical protein